MECLGLRLRRFLVINSPLAGNARNTRIRLLASTPLGPVTCVQAS